MDTTISDLPAAAVGSNPPVTHGRSLVSFDNLQQRWRRGPPNDVSHNDLYVLRLKDIKSSDSDESLRPFIFNLQQHMIDKAQGYIDHCVIQQSADGNSTFVGYQKKPEFFHLSQESSVDIIDGGHDEQPGLRMNESSAPL